MSEDVAAPEQASGSADTSGVALDLALEAARADPAHFARVDAFLAEQMSLIALQKHHLHEQFKQLGPTLWEKRLGVLLRLATAFIGLAIAAAAAFLIWNAAQSNDLVIDAFAVPPELAARGLSGPVVAAKLSDHIAAMQAQTQSERPARSYADGLSEGLKLEIPETGVSLSELDRFLRQKLGHDLHIGGEVVQTGMALSLTARAGSDGSVTVAGPVDDTDGSIQRLAEGVYRITQPYRYANYLRTHGRREESVAIYRDLASKGPLSERGWAYLAWSNDVRQQNGESAARELMQRGMAADPNHYLLPTNLASGDAYLGRDEDRLRHNKQALALLLAHGAQYTNQDIPARSVSYKSQINLLQGNLMEAAEPYRHLAVDTGDRNADFNPRQGALFLALHELDLARAALEDFNIDDPNLVGRTAPGQLQIKLALALANQDWQAVLSGDKWFGVLAARYPGFSELKYTVVDPYIALALARTGHLDAAELRISRAPADCYHCLRARAQVAALHGDGARADLWFARAAAQGPSMPYAESEWGQALLDRKQPEAAIQKFRQANRKSPHFADPLEYWGEALMAKNQSHLALAKFRQAEPFAPNWGRLHLKWGEALVYAGKKAEAQKHFARAAQLDLTPSEKSELAQALR